MLQTVFFVSLLALASPALASGCGSYDYWLQIDPGVPAQKYAGSEYDIVSWNDSFVRLRFHDEPGKIWTLPLESKVPDYAGPDPMGQAVKEDVTFEEGFGCGPVYDCLTGRVRVVLPAEFFREGKGARIYAWPVLISYSDYDRKGWAAGDLLAPFKIGAPAPGSSDLPQCSYGNW